jgi:phosphoribosylformimino-5-aminoimidazole carboxamide ribotide isomerase
MDILPAIDLRDGKVVRLAKGDYDRQTTYGDDPGAVAREFVSAGAAWIHVVDLDAARSGELTNTDILAELCRQMALAGVRVQNGGGIRDRKRVEMLLALGVSRVVIGSAALKDWPWFSGLLEDDSIANESIALGLDARDGLLAAQGWTEQTDIAAVDLARRVCGSGLGAIVYTDIARDGMLTGVNIESTAQLIAATDVPVIASGGVKGIEDIRSCQAINCGGVIVGKALYEKKIDLAKVVELAGR